LQSPDLSRGYSDQKREYQKGLRSVIFKSFKLAESEFNFSQAMTQLRMAEKRRIQDEI
jgi:hypothetical protein